MKNKVSFFIIMALLMVSPSSSFSKEPVHVDVLFMNHGPLQPTLRKLHALFPNYKDKVTASWYDFDSNEGIDFKTKMGITKHEPMTIWINGQFERLVNGREIKFQGFPTGSGPSFFQGEWKVEDLADLLDQLTKDK